MIANNPKSEILDRLPPREIDAERWVAGSLILKSSLLDDVLAVCSPDDFVDLGCRCVVLAVKKLAAAGSAVDVGTVRLEMKAADQLEDAGGVAFLAELMRDVPTAAHAIYYAQRIIATAKLRSLIRANERALQDAYEVTADADAIAKRLESEAAAIQERGRLVDTRPISEAATAAMARFERIASSGVAPGLLTGLRPIDDAVGGLHDGELNILAGRPGSGKTSLGMQIAMHTARAGTAVLFVSLEMGGDELAARSICAESGVDSNEVRRGQLTESDLQALRDETARHQDLPITLTEATRVTVADIRAAAKQQQRQGKLALLVVDYLTRIIPSDQRRPRHEQVGQISADLKDLAVELNVPLLVLAQLNRQGDGGRDGRPRLSHLRESGSIEADADQVWLLSAPSGDADHPGIAVLDVAKNRNGRTGEIRLFWDHQRTKFRSPSAQATSQNWDAWQDPEANVEIWHETK